MKEGPHSQLYTKQKDNKIIWEQLYADKFDNLW